MATVTTGYSFSDAETNVTHTKLNNAVNNATVTAIVAADITDGVLTAAKLGTAAVTTAKLDDLAVTNAKIAAATIDLTAKVTGALPIGNGGTGQVTATAAFDALAPGTTQGDLIFHNGTDHVRLAKGTAGQPLTMNSGATAPEWGKAIPLAPAAGDLLYFNGTAWISLGKGTALQNLRQNAGETAPEWAAPAAAGVFTLSFTSTEQTIAAGGVLTLAHSLAVIPLLVQLRAICTTAELGYSIGNIVLVSTAAGYSTSNGLTVEINATNVIVYFGTANPPIPIKRKDNNAETTMTAANWNLIVKAWA